MSVQKYPWSVDVYIGEQRLLIIPVINHVGGFSVDSGWSHIIYNFNDYFEIGTKVLSAIEFVEGSPLSESTPKERQQNMAWKKCSRFKGWISFWKNNYLIPIHLYEDGRYKIYSCEKDEELKGVYNGCIKEIWLPQTASPDEIGKAVIDVYWAAEEFYAKKNGNTET